MFATHFHYTRLFSSLLFCLLLGLPYTVQAATPPSVGSRPAQFDFAPDWQTITNEAEGFQVEIPAQWEILELSESAIGLGMAIVGENNPQLQALLSNATFRQLLATGMKFYALDLSDSALRYALPANINIIKVEIGGDLPIATLQKLNERQLASLAEADYPVRSEIVTSYGREALLFQYVVAYDLGFSEPQLIAVNQLLLVEEGVQYILTVGVPLAAVDDYLDRVVHIIDSFQLLTDQPAPTPLAPPTATPAPTVATTPTRRLLRIPTPTPAPQAFAVVKVAKLNIRTGPNTNYGVIGSANQNERLLVIGRVDDRCSWLKVQLPVGKSGWIAGPPTYSSLEGNCNDISVTPPPPPPPAAAKPCVRFDNHFNKVADVTLTMPANPTWNQKFNIAPHGRQLQCLAPGRYTVSIGVPGEGSVNGEFTLERGGPLQVIPIYQEFN